MADRAIAIVERAAFPEVKRLLRSAIPETSDALSLKLETEAADWEARGVGGSHTVRRVLVRPSDVVDYLDRGGVADHMALHRIARDLK